MAAFILRTYVLGEGEEDPSGTERLKKKKKKTGEEMMKKKGIIKFSQRTKGHKHTHLQLVNVAQDTN